MMKRIKKQNGIMVLVVALSMAMLYSCASIGNPNGGPYDENPPKFMSSTPTPNQTSSKGNRVEILFDELIQLERPSENVIVSPPQMQLPVIRTSARRIVVELKDTLKENTTYTLDFTNSIADNNEKNVLENFTFAFSTGDMIDSLEISGILLNAENLEPMPGVTIGLHSNLEDSAFVKEPFLRTSRTNYRGRFTIRNIATGAYRLYALNDVNRDYRYDQPGEEIAFYDQIITPTFEFSTRQDTLWVDSLTIDTIHAMPYTRFLPDNVNLFLFKEPFERQYMLRPERQIENKFTLRFNTSLDTIPQPVPLNFMPIEDDWYYVHTEDQNKVVNFWITDSAVWKQDTLRMELTYPLSDSLNILQPQTDTLQIVMRRAPQKRQSRRDEEEKEKISFIPLNINTSGSVNIYDTISITFDEPVIGLTGEEFFLNQKVDSLWIPVDFEFLPDSTNSLRFYLLRKWNYSEEYLLEVDSATIYNVYGRWNNTYSGEFEIKPREEYGHLYINISGVDTTAFVQLLDANDSPVRQEKVNDGGALFMNLKPENYYARLILDLNNNGKWDAGSYVDKRQPEPVYYCPKQFTVMQNWEVEESWSVNSTSIERQKPLDIIKNKPKEAPTKNRDYRNEGRATSSGSSGRSGLPF